MTSIGFEMLQMNLKKPVNAKFTGFFLFYLCLVAERGGVETHNLTYFPKHTKTYLKAIFSILSEIHI